MLGVPSLSCVTAGKHLSFPPVPPVAATPTELLKRLQPAQSLEHTWCLVTVPFLLSETHSPRPRRSARPPPGPLPLWLRLLLRHTTGWPSLPVFASAQHSPLGSPTFFPFCLCNAHCSCRHGRAHPLLLPVSAQQAAFSEPLTHKRTSFTLCPVTQLYFFS